jgi:hypothetical protein
MVSDTPAREAGAPPEKRSQRGWLWAVPFAFVAVAASFATLFATAGRSALIHDEHQFIVPGLLTLRDGLLPYRDYPLFHVPYVVLLNAVGFEATGGDVFLGCRLPAAMAGWLTAALIGWQGFRWLRPRAGPLGLVIAAAVMLAICVSPVTIRACGFSWNHQWPTLLMIIAVLMIFRLERRYSWAICFVAGAAIGIASAMRLSFLPMLAPLGLAVLFLPAHSWNERFRAALVFSSGTIMALLPCIYLMAVAPEASLFGNFGYPKLSVPRKELPFWGDKSAKTVDPVLGYLGDPKVFQGRTLKGKLKHASRQFFPPNAGILAVGLLVGIPGAIWAIRRRPDQRFRALLLLGGLPFVIWGSLAPSRFHQQYWYATIPWLALLALSGFSQLAGAHGWRKRSTAIALVALVISLVAAATVSKLFAPGFSGFFAVASSLRPQPGFSDLPGPVLTLHPTPVAAGHGRIYPELSSGEFGWRSSHLLPKEKRQRLKLLSPFDLNETLALRPPASIVVLYAKDEMEQPLIRWAEDNKYDKQPDLGVYQVWTKPSSVQP